MHKSITSNIYISDLSNSMEMEEQKDYLSPNNAVPTNNTGSSRWNPTKEQIAMLESLYKQGLRTPSAEQIQNITGKLREFGSIEGKNVFYWFQNHKARQRQKHKQQSFAYYTRLLRKSPVVLSAPPLMPPPFNPSFSPPLPCNQAGVIYRPFIQQANGQNYYTQAQHPAMFYADQAFNKNGPSPGFQRTGKTENPNPGLSVPCKGNSVKMTRETLQLFPLHPSNRRLSDSEKAGIGLPSGSASVESFENCDGDEGEEEVENQNQFLIDFLGALNGSS